MAELTPMKRQYYEIKQRNPDCLLFFRLGDFYEMFEEDARIASRELDLTLTSRDHAKDKSAEDKIPMCGVPYHSSESYIARLVAKGYKVAICEQMEDPALAKGLRRSRYIRPVLLRCVDRRVQRDAGFRSRRHAGRAERAWQLSAVRGPSGRYGGGGRRAGGFPARPLPHLREHRHGRAV